MACDDPESGTQADSALARSVSDLPAIRGTMQTSNAGSNTNDPLDLVARANCSNPIQCRRSRLFSSTGRRRGAPGCRRRLSLDWKIPMRGAAALPISSRGFSGGWCPGPRTQDCGRFSVHCRWWAHDLRPRGYRKALATELEAHDYDVVVFDQYGMSWAVTYVQEARAQSPGAGSGGT